MTELHVLEPSPQAASPAPGGAVPARWARPAFEVISLDCEITAYAPDDGGETPLF